MRIWSLFVYTMGLLGLATAHFVWSLPRPPLMASKLMWFVEPMHYLMIVGWPIIAFSSSGFLEGLAIAAVLMVVFTALLIWLWRRPRMLRWLLVVIFAWIGFGSFLVWADIVASI